MGSEIGSNSIRNYRRIRRTVYDPRKDDVMPYLMTCENCGQKTRFTMVMARLFRFPPGDPRIAANQGREFVRSLSYWCRDCALGAPIENEKGVTNVSVSD